MIMECVIMENKHNPIAIPSEVTKVPDTKQQIHGVLQSKKIIIDLQVKCMK